MGFAYLSTVKISGSESESEIREVFGHQLKQSFDEEAECSRTKSGPHRDDLSVWVDGQEARVYSSRGQQRSVVLSLKISLLKMWKEEAGEYPVLLMDDVFSELDEKRRNFLLDVIGSGVQSFITTAEAGVHSFGNIKSARFFSVISGTISCKEVF